MLTSIVRSERGYALYQDKSRYVLCVQCGSSNMYELCIALAPADVQRVLEDSDYLDEIADRIMYDPDRFAPYRVAPPTL